MAPHTILLLLVFQWRSAMKLHRLVIMNVLTASAVQEGMKALIHSFRCRSFTAMVLSHDSQVIRHCISGGEPLLHPEIDDLLELPKLCGQSGFVCVTNGTVRDDLDQRITENNWCVIVSLHGRESTHNAYTRSTSFGIVSHRIRKLASQGYVNIFAVLNPYTKIEDLEWLLAFRDEVGAGYLSLLRPRPFGRFQKWDSPEVEAWVGALSAERVRLRAGAAGIPFVGVDGRVRRSN